MNDRSNYRKLLASWVPVDIDGGEALVELALNLSWSWNHRADDIWSELDPVIWEHTRNPWVMLKDVSRDKIKTKMTDPKFRKTVEDLLQAQKEDHSSKGWFDINHPNSPLKCIAYFSMEYMLAEALPIYSGGLGNVAGDQLKSASDLGVPVVAVGLLYQQGYFRQLIDKDGNQQALYPYNDPGQLPISPVRLPDGEWLRIEVKLPGWSIWLRTWQVQVGKATLYLLDSNDASNYPAHRGITSELYGGGSELRLKQELILGIGGWRLLTALGIKPDVCHLNEGHAAFAILERARCYMLESGLPFMTALAATRPGNLFTTHTAVPAGFDQFPPALIEQFLTSYTLEQLGITMKELLAFGRINPNDPNENFNMAYLAIHGSGAINAVSRLHGKVSRHIFEPLFPRWPQEEVPVQHVTNGVHMPSWDSKPSDDLWEEACGKTRWLGSTEKLESEIRRIPDAKLWKMRNISRQRLIEYIRSRLTRILAARGDAPETVELAKQMFDPHTLTLGFARRFATYKRPTMLLHDPERLIRILNNPNRPVQLVIAGKAHPADKPGQALIQEWMRFIKRPECRSRVVFLTDYDMLMTEHLVMGVDVWMNTPRRPWEACGTSGMKVLVNGGLNLSELDGWWAEAYSPEVGWAIGDGKEHGTDLAWDAAEANALYDLLENEVIPEFYNRDKEGMPKDWIKRIRESMAKLTPQYSANRAVREYTERFYIPAATNYKMRVKDSAKLAKDIIIWEKELNAKWSSIRFSDVQSQTADDKHMFEVQVYMDNLNPDFVAVQLYAEGVDGNLPEVHQMSRGKELSGTPNTFFYTASIPAKRNIKVYTARVVPFYEGAHVPMEANQILWQH